MAKRMIMFVLVAIAMCQFMVKPGQAVRAVTCGQVDSSLAPCIPFLTGGGTPTAACCSGVKNIKALSGTTADKRAACNCVKEAAARYTNIKDDAATSLPTKCEVDFDIPISRNTNCDVVGAVTCGQVDSSLAPCIPYLTGGGTPTTACCSGVKNIKALSGTTADKRVACNCVKEAAARYTNIKDDAATSLPTKCGVDFDIPISRNTNCDLVGAVTCGQVDSALAPCIPYLTGGGTPTTACCSGVKNIKALSGTTADKRVACNCVKEAAARYTNIKDDAATSLPTKCGVDFDIPISRNTNCDVVGAVTCGQVDSSLAPCIPYLTGGGTPTTACCSGVKNIKALSGTTADKREACNCVKQAAARYTNIKDDAATSLPTKCGVDLDIPISRNTNCDVINA